MALRRYSDHDVALILRRALKLEEQRDRFEVPDGVTLKELCGIAREVGIDSGLIEVAAAELDQASSPAARALATESAVVREIRALPRRLGTEEVDYLMTVLEYAVPEPGIATRSPDGVRWTSLGRFRNTQVAVRPTIDETVISVEASLGDARSMTIGVPGAFGAVLGTLMGAQDGPLVALAMAIIMTVGGVIVGGGLWQIMLDRQIERVRALMDRLVSVARARAPSSGARD